MDMFENYFDKQKTTLLRVGKNEILQSPGAITCKAFYVKKGLLRSYLIDQKGKIHTFTFAPEGWIISDIEAFMFSSPTELYIDALEDSEIVEINQISTVTFETPNSVKPEIIQKLLKRIAVLQKRVMLLMSAPAKQRYQHFIETYPQLVNRVQLKMIASYLGITPEALSAIRANMKN